MARMPGPARVSSASSRFNAAVVATRLPSGQSATESAPAPPTASALARADVDAAVGATAERTGAATAPAADLPAGYAGAAGYAGTAGYTGTAPTCDANSKLPSGTTAQPVPDRATANPSPMKPSS